MADVTIPQDAVQMEIVVMFNMLSGEVRVTGCDKNPIVALGMLDYALARVRRALTTNDIVQEMKNSPLVAIPRGGLA